MTDEQIEKVLKLAEWHFSKRAYCRREADAALRDGFEQISDYFRETEKFHLSSAQLLETIAGGEG